MNVYHIKEFNQDYLRSKGFIFDYELSTSDIVVLSRTSVVYRNNNRNILEIKISIFSDKTVRINCYKANTNNPYAGWYNRKYGKSVLPNIIDKFINRECKKLGIEKRKQKDEPTRSRRVIQNK